MKVNRLIISGAAVALVMAVLAGWFFWPDRGFVRADLTDPRAIERGRTVYTQNCASCHGARLEGQPDWRSRRADGRLPAPPHDASGHTWHHSDEQLFGITKHGLAPYVQPGYESDMPAYEGTLSDSDIWAVLAFIKSTWPARERAYQENINRRTRDGAAKPPP